MASKRYKDTNGFDLRVFAIRGWMRFECLYVANFRISVTCMLITRKKKRIRDFSRSMQIALLARILFSDIKKFRAVNILFKTTSKTFFFLFDSKVTRENYLTHSISLEVSIHFPRNLYNTILPNVKEDFTILRLRLAQEFFKKFPSTRTTEI